MAWTRAAEIDDARRGAGATGDSVRAPAERELTPFHGAPTFRPVSTLTAITLRGMRFHTLVGILPHERELPQPLEVDVTAWVPHAPGASLDYRELYSVVATRAAAGCGFIEDLADTVAAGVLELPQVRRVMVAVRKPHVPLPGPLAYAEVRVERER